MKNRKILLVKRPKGTPDKDDFKIVEGSVPAPGQGEVLIKSLYISVDPYMRGRMRNVKTYVEPFPLNEVIVGGVVGEVIKSKAPDYKEGDIVMSNFGWQDYSVAKTEGLRKIDSTLAPVSTSLGILGMPGLTAYFGFLDICKPEKGETLVISGAAGAVGITVGQIGKIKGCNVIGIAGSDEKIKYITEELGFDGGINYKTSKKIRKDLKLLCPDGIDLYFDNVGGPISDDVMTLINYKARISICGQIALYNLERPEPGPRVQMQLLIKSALMRGFIVSDYESRFSEGISQLAKWIKEGKLKYKETIVEGLENTPDAFIGLFQGENTGKQIVKV